MKKIFILLMLLSCSLAANATIRYQCVPEPYPVGSKLSGVMNTLSGANFVGRKTVEGIVKSNLKKNTDADFKVKLTPFNATDLLAGKFRSFEFSTDEANLGGIYVHDIEGKTLCEYNRIVFEKDKPPKIYEDFFVGFSGKITNDDLQKTLQAQQFDKYIKNMHLKVGGISLVKMQNPKLFIAGNKLKYTFHLSTLSLLGEVSRDVSCDVGLKVNKGKISLSLLDADNYAGLPDELFNKIINRINPFRFNLKKTLGIPSYLDVDDVKIDKGEIIFSGTFVAPKNIDLEE